MTKKKTQYAALVENHREFQFFLRKEKQWYDVIKQKGETITTERNLNQSIECEAEISYRCLISPETKAKIKHKLQNFKDQIGWDSLRTITSWFKSQCKSSLKSCSEVNILASFVILSTSVATHWQDLQTSKTMNVQSICSNFFHQSNNVSEELLMLILSSNPSQTYYHSITLKSEDDYSIPESFNKILSSDAFSSHLLVWEVWFNLMRVITFNQTFLITGSSTHLKRVVLNPFSLTQRQLDPIEWWLELCVRIGSNMVVSRAL